MTDFKWLFPDKLFSQKQTEEFAIGFAEWILDNYDSDDASKFGMFYTKNMEELLEIYKKEKGL
jgi:hypothetical protein